MATQKKLHLSIYEIFYAIASYSKSRALSPKSFGICCRYISSYTSRARAQKVGETTWVAKGNMMEVY